MNSRERVKAALYFNKPDQVPILNNISGDVFPLPITYSENWNPGWNRGEEGLFPHVRHGFLWKRPSWANQNSEWEDNRWKSIPHEEIDAWGCIWNKKGNDQDMGHPGRASLLNWEDFNEYISKYRPDASDKSRYRLAFPLLDNLQEKKYLMYFFVLSLRISPNCTIFFSISS